MPVIRRGEYVWERDFPKHLQKKGGDKNSVIRLEFALDEDEVKAFKEEIGNSLNGSLPIELKIGDERFADVRVKKQGRGATSLSQKSSRIARFIANRFDLEYIPAIRTAKSAKTVVEDMIQRELAILEDNVEYANAVKRIAHIQKPVLAKLSENIKQTLTQFLPDVSAVDVTISDDHRYRALSRNAEIMINDGYSTGLELKGDGVQSLAALGIMRHASERSIGKRSLLIAIEEPESHLHPAAIHKLKTVIDELSEKHQVILSTHCPLFVDRGVCGANILVRDSKATPAKSISEVRDTLGVRESDNLKSAEIVILAEGEHDARSLGAMLKAISTSAKRRLENGQVAIEPLHGASKLKDRLLYLQNLIYPCVCFLDNDQAGRDAATISQDSGLIDTANIFFAIRDGNRESEYEDLLDVDLYKNAIEKRFGITLNNPRFKSNKKWSERLAATLHNQGKASGETEIKIAKGLICDLVLTKPKAALSIHHRQPIVGLSHRINTLLSKS